MEPRGSEREPGAEGSVARVKAHLAQALNGGPNIAAEYDGAKDELHISPRYVIPLYGIVVREGSEHGPYTGEATVDAQIQAANEIGGKTVEELAVLMQGGAVDGEDITPVAFLTNRSSANYLREQLYRSSLLNLIGADEDGRPSSDQSIVLDVRNALRKGLPPPISEALIIGVTKWLATTTDGVVTEEAKKMDDLTTGKPQLETELDNITKEGIPQAEQSITTLQEKKQQADQALTTAQEKAQPWTEAQQAIRQFIRQRFGHCSEDELQRLRSTLPTNTQLLRERGFLLGKTVEVDPDGFARFDDALRTLASQSSEVKGALGKFEQQDLIDTVLLSVKDHLNDLVQGSSRDSNGLNELFGVANLLLGQEPTARQLELFSKLAGSAKTQEEAKRFLTDFLTRAVTYSLLKNGLRVPTAEKALPWVLNEIMPEPAFFQLLDKSLTTEEFAPIKAEFDGAGETKKGVDSQLSSQEENLRTLKERQESMRERLAELTRTSSERLGSQKRAILGKLLVTAVGNHEPKIDNSRVNATYKEYLESKLLEDVATAVFLGLPHFIANDERHPQAAARAYARLRESMRSVGIAGQFSEQSLKNLRDFLPDIVAALLSEDHPTPELATQLACDLLRNFVPNTTVLQYAGLESQGKTLEAAAAFQGKAIGLVGEIMQGGRVTSIPEDIPRLPLEEIRALNLAGKKSEVQELDQRTLNPLLAYLRQLGYENGVELVSGAAIQSPGILKEHNCGYLSVDDRMMRQGEQKGEVPYELLFDQEFGGGAGYYVIERKTPRPQY